MLLSIDHLKGYKISGIDGDIGHVDSFLFEDTTWHIRYLVVDTTMFIFGKKVLLSPHCINSIHLDVLNVELSVDQIRNSPLIDTDKPVSRQKEAELHRFYGWPYYWENTAPIGVMGATPVVPPMGDLNKPLPENEGDPHLRSTGEVIGYWVNSKTEKPIGIVKDFIANTDDWHMPFSVVETGEKTERKQVLITTDWIRKILWEKDSVSVTIPERVLNGLKTFNPHEPINSVYEEILYDYYGIPQYRNSYV